jgi:sec-independent protein translocase protein TatB
MFDLGWTELLLIGIVALIVVGPKDLPGMFRTVGQFVGKAKGMAREFSKAMNDAADEAGVSGINDSLKKATNPIGAAMDEVRKSTKSFTEATRDAGKPKLSSERQDAKDKITEHSAKATQARLDREKAEADAAASVAPAEATPEPSVKKTTAKAADKPKAKAKSVAKSSGAPKTTVKAAAKKTTASKSSPGAKKVATTGKAKAADKKSSGGTA